MNSSNDTVMTDTKKRDKKTSSKSLQNLVTDLSLKEQEDCPMVRVSEIDCSKTLEVLQDLSSLVKDIERTGRGPAKKHRINQQKPLLK